MAIKAIFPTGVDSITLSKGLYQWDYGQQLEIEAVDLSPIVEVHFSCQGMKEAEVRPCNTVNGTAIVAIPDICLEQSSKITAWVFEIDGEQGHTTKTINIPIIPRTRPAKSSAIPQGFVDCYTELISEVNAAVKVIADGDVTAKYAISAGNASSANTAGHANTADNVSGKMGEVSQYTHVWFSDPDTETKRAFSERLTYNPRDNTLKVGHLDGKASSAVRADTADNARNVLLVNCADNADYTSDTKNVVRIHTAGLYVVEMYLGETNTYHSVTLMISDANKPMRSNTCLITDFSDKTTIELDCRYTPTPEENCIGEIQTHANKYLENSVEGYVTTIINIYRIGGLEG